MLIVFTPFSSAIDITLTKHFYLQNTEGTYAFAESPFIKFFYDYGEYPAFAVGALASALWLISYKVQKIAKWRPAFLHLMLTLILAAGIITNGLLKEYWGRPRPKQTIEFGGKHQFHPWYQYDFAHRDESLKSFPSGHAIMGYYFLAFVVIGQYYRKEWLTWLGVVGGLGLGGILSFIRIAQGGHFISDTLMSALVAWICILIIGWYCFGRRAVKPVG